MRKSSKKIILTGLVLILAAASVFAKAKDKKNKNAPTDSFNGHVAKELNVGYVDGTGGGQLSGVLGIARDKGFLEEEFKKIGVKINLIPMTGAGPAINEALAGGSLDIGVLGDVPAVLGKANGLDTVLIAYDGLHNIASVISGKGTTYKSLRELKGKKIATQKGAFMHRYLGILLKAEGLTFDDIEWINAQANVATEMILSGNVDAIVGAPAKLIEQGYNIVIDGRNHPLLHSGGGTIARRKYVEQNPDIIKAYILAYTRARDYAKEHSNALVDQWVSTGEKASTYEYLYPKNDAWPTIVKTPETEANFKEVLQFLIEYDLTINKKGFSIEDWYDGRFAEYAVAEAAKK